MTQPALIGDPLVLRTATEEAEIDHLRQTLNEGHYLMAGRPEQHPGTLDKATNWLPPGFKRHRRSVSNPRRSILTGP